ncbi:MAG: 2-iminoacetate synthase ThiH [Deltaproteobacteria bacterium]|nr:2-iminoacetate synthase ThiH [Deltaproteobacteria bacterium]
MELSEIEKRLQPLSNLDLLSLLERARQLTCQRFGRVIQMYAPLYLSNECVDTCTYCGFSLANKIPRKTLTPDEVIAEANHLLQQGFQHLLLVAGEHPLHVSPDYLEKIIQKLKPRLASLSIEVAPFEEAVYRRLIQSGLDGIVIYQETYNQDRYATVHRAGPKKNYEKRIQAPMEAARAGIRLLGMGILLGLNDWREDALSLIDHVRRVRKNFGAIDVTVSLPRLRPSASDFPIPSPVSDRDFIQLVAILRLALPEVGIILSTRESPALRDALIGLGITQMSAGSRTEPGGYVHPEASLKQFEIEDNRSVAEITQTIARKGYEPVWKNWEGTL